MKTDKYFKSLFFGFMQTAVLAGCLLSVSCADDIFIGEPTNAGNYESVNRVDAMLFDVSTNMTEAVVEMRDDRLATELLVQLSQKPSKGIDVEIVFDPSYSETYNATHNTKYAIFPGEVQIENDGRIVLAPDDVTSPALSLTLKSSDDMVSGTTYILPVSLNIATDGITVAECSRHVVYLVKDLRGQGNDTYKGRNAVKSVVYIEVNDANPLNALELELSNTGKLLFDEVIIFSSNINWDNLAGRVYLKHNQNVQFLLDHNEEFIQPLRRRGIKVILSVLGNHDIAGPAQLSAMGAREFAKELAACCEAYNLDGVGFDDEYTQKPDLSNPWLAAHTTDAAARLLYETKKAMPDKTVMVYYLNEMNARIPAVDGMSPNLFVDYVVPDYAQSVAAAPMTGMTVKNCAGASINLSFGSGGTDDQEIAASRKAAGYGYYMFYNLNPSNYQTQISKINYVCNGLYGQPVSAPKYYYKQGDATRYPIEQE